MVFTSFLSDFDDKNEEIGYDESYAHFFEKNARCVTFYKFSDENKY